MSNIGFQPTSAWHGASDRFFALSIDLLCVIDRDGCFVQLSRSWEQVLGYTQAEMSGALFLDYVHADDRQASLEAFLSHGRHHAVTDFVNRYRTKAGQYRHLSWRSSAPDGDGLICAVARDITDQGRLQGERDFLAAIVNHSRDPVYCLSPRRDFTIVYVNDAICTFLGLPRDEILTSPAIRFDPMMTREWQERTWSRIRQSDVPIVIETTLTLGDGRTVPVEISASATRHQGEEYVVGWIHDISLRREAEEARQGLSEKLARTAHQWSAAMESFQAGIAVLDRERRLLHANGTFLEMTRSSADRIGRVVHDLVEGCNGHGPFLFAEGMDMVLEANDPANPSGRPLEVRAAPILDVCGNADGMVLSLYDLSHLREQERRLEQTVAELTRSNAELERFGQVAAHDLQEPTRRQVLFAQLLQRKLAGRLDVESRQIIDFLISDALRMRDMVRALNVYHQAGQSVRPAEAVDLDRVVGDVLGVLAEEIDVSRAVLCLSPLGPVLGQRSRLHLLFANLVSNALKFRRPQCRPRITVTATEAGRAVEVAVADNGVGIPEQYRANLFTLFRRLTPELAARGTGMGLAQCRRIVEDLGGRIWIEGNEQGGVTVKFTLPRP